ncbi:MAG: hypothetical protein ACI4I6_06605 [Hominimerdicola sp.]
MSLDVDTAIDVATAAIETTIDEKLLDIYFKSGSFLKSDFVKFKNQILSPEKNTEKSADEILDSVENILDSIKFKKRSDIDGIGNF